MHLLGKFKLSRRTLLRGAFGGAAVAVALPPLEAMFDGQRRARAAEGTPKRFISFFFGNGTILSDFEPATTGADWTPSVLLEPLAPVKEYVSVVTGLHNRCEQIITHHEGMTVFSGYTYVERPDLPGIFASDFGGPTIDQVIAEAIAAGRDAPPVHSIQAGIAKAVSQMGDNGSTAQVLSVRPGQGGSLVPLPPEYDPKKVWQTLFGEFVPKSDDRELRLSMLDLIRDDAARLKQRLGVTDRNRVDAHLQALFELENKITTLPPACDFAPEPTLDNAEPDGSEQTTMVNQVMAELIAQAFVCDITRVASINFLKLAGDPTFAETDAPDTHHNLSHDAETSQSARTEYRENLVYIFERFHDLLNTLKNTTDIDGTNLLDSTIVYASTDCSVGWDHSIRRHPIILAGTGGGYLQYPGIHYQAIPNDPDDPNAEQPNAELPTTGNTSDVLLTVLKNFDPDAERVGDGAAASESVISELLA